MDSTPPADIALLPGWHRSRAGVRVGLVGVFGVVVAVGTALAAPNRYAPMIGWDAAALLFLVWTWLSIWPHGPTHTALLATREDPSRGVMDVVLLSTAVISLGSVGLALFGAGQVQGGLEIVRVLLGVLSVALSWAVVHTVFCLKYASLFYGQPPGGIEFRSEDDPDYADFAYLAFTIGMTYQVSDTDLTSRIIRRTALRHALISFLFGTVILAATINLVAGLSK